MSGRVGSITTPIITDGLVFNMDAANRASYPRSGTTATDTVSNVNGTLTNGTTFSNSNKGIFDFDGTNDYIDCGSISAINSSSTVSVSYWGKKTASNKYSLIGSQMSSTNGFWLTWWHDGNVYCSFRNGNISYAGYALSFDTNWHHFVGVYNGSSIKIYIDSILQATSTTSIPTSLSSTGGNDFNIGYLQSQYTDGNIGPVQIYNRALSSTEVLHNYNALKPRFGL